MASKRFVRSTPGGGPAKPNGQVSKRPAPRAVDPDDEYDDVPGTRGVTDDDEDGGEAIRGGWGASQETIDSTSQYAQAFKPETKSQVIKLLEGRPYASFRRHWIDRVGIGKRAYVCLQSVGKDCPLCNVGDKPGAVTAFNIAVLSDDGVPALKSWDCGVKLTKQLETFHKDPKIGPLEKRTLYFLVSKTEATQRQQVTTMVNPVRERDLLEDYGVPPLTDEQMTMLRGKCYTVDIIGMTPAHELEEIAAELTGESVGAKGWGE
jgi:hypothetical protein